MIRWIAAGFAAGVGFRLALPVLTLFAFLAGGLLLAAVLIIWTTWPGSAILLLLIAASALALSSRRRRQDPPRDPPQDPPPAIPPPWTPEATIDLVPAEPRTDDAGGRVLGKLRTGGDPRALTAAEAAWLREHPAEVRAAFEEAGRHG